MRTLLTFKIVTILLVVAAGAFNASQAQTVGLISQAKIKIIGGWKDPNLSSSGRKAWRCKVEYLDDTYPNNNLNPCADIGSASGQELIIFSIDNTQSTTLTLNVRGWAEHSGDGCDSSHDDDNRVVAQNIPIKFSDLKPGVNNTYPVYLNHPQNGLYYRVDLQIYFTVPVPRAVTALNPDFLCANNPVTIRTQIDNISNASNVQLKWQYHINGDVEEQPCPGSCNPADYCKGLEICSTNGVPGCVQPANGKCTPSGMPACCLNPVTNEIWTTLGTTNYSGIYNNYSFNPYSHSKIRNAAGKKDIYFRVIATASSTSSMAPRSNAYHISYAAPTAVVESLVPACSGQKDGQINFRINGAVNNYKWYVLKEIADCSQQQILDGNCGANDTENYGSSNGGLVTAKVHAGTYVLVVQNWGTDNQNNNGGCYRHYNDQVVVTVPDLNIAAPTKKDLTCFESNDGSITVNGSGGDAGTIQYGLNLLGEPTAWQKTPTFNNLVAGTYVTNVKDRCESLSADTLLKQPDAPITATAEHAVPQCHDSGDGHIVVTPTGGYGDYAVTLLKGGDILRQFNIYTDGEAVVFDKLSYGNYTYTVQDIAGNCDIVTEDIILPEPPRLRFSLISVVPVTCPESWPDDGEATFSVQNAAFPYTITMTHTGTGQAYTSNNEVVSNLPEGIYNVGIAYNNGCPDAYALPSQIEITKPEPILIDLLQDDMTCTGSFDASISATITGGNTGAYAYRWQTESGGQWLDFNDPERQDGLKLKNLYDGVYRLFVTDSKGCEKASASVEIVNPDPLVIEEVILTGLECKEEENGHILPGVTGGWGNYIYEYQKLPDTNWQTFDLSDAFDQGTYRIRVTDREGCMTEWADDLFFAEADEPLELTGLDSRDYNGYHISCFGQSDGKVTISAKGGLLSQALGYEYAVDNEPFTTNNFITGLAAGEHTFHVRDNNGCIKSQVLQMIEPEELDISVIDIKHVKCFGDNTGFIEVEGTGGVEPYIFAIDDQYYRTSPVFRNLTSGNYDLIIRDKNICFDTVTTTINNLFPPITFNWTVDSVTCYNYSDGAAQVDVIGGNDPYEINWSHDRETESTTLSGLTSGRYHLQVQDEEGCIASDSTYVPQPPNVNAGPDLNLCYEQDAVLDASWNYGAAQYQWSNNGSTLSEKPTLFIDKAGNYVATVSLDYRECVMYDTVKVETYDIQFNAKFLAATDLVLGDTLQLVETSSPPLTHCTGTLMSGQPC